MKVIYLDNNATTMVAPEVFEAMKPFFMDRYANPSSMHSFGGSVAREVRKARENLAALLGAGPQEVVFTSGGTESDSTSILSALNTMPGRREIVTTRVEHPAVLNLCKHLERDHDTSCVGFPWTRKARSISTKFVKRLRTARQSYRSCGLTTRPA